MKASGSWSAFITLAARVSCQCSRVAFKSMNPTYNKLFHHVKDDKLVKSLLWAKTDHLGIQHFKRWCVKNFKLFEELATSSWNLAPQLETPPNGHWASKTDFLRVCQLWLWLNFFLVILNIGKRALQGMLFFDGRNFSERSLSKQNEQRH